MNWIEDNDGLSQEQLDAYNRFFNEWRRLFEDNRILENHYCVEEFYLERRLYLTDHDFFIVLNRVHLKKVNINGE